MAPAVKGWYPKLVAMLPSEGYEAPGKVSITFSKDMTDGSWSWATASQDSFPKSPKADSKAKYEDDKRTCVLPVKIFPAVTSR